MEERLHGMVDEPTASIFVYPVTLPFLEDSLVAFVYITNLVMFRTKYMGVRIG